MITKASSGQILDVSDPDCWILPSTSSKMLTIACFTGGVFSLLGMATVADDWSSYAVSFFFGIVMMWAGFSARGESLRKAVFDFRRQAYWQDHRMPGPTLPVGKMRKFLPLAEIAALRINVASNDEAEQGLLCCLQIVRRDGKAIEVIEYPRPELLSADAAALAERLHVPLQNHTEPGWEKRRRAGWIERVAPYVFGAVFFCGGLFFAYFFAFQPLKLYWESRNWVPVPAEVVTSRLSHESGGRRLDLTCRYQYAGKIYTGGEYDLVSSRMSSRLGERHMRAIIAAHPPGSTVRCLVDPDDPGRTLIRREVPKYYWFWGIFPFLFVGIGIATLFGAFGARGGRV